MRCQRDRQAEEEHVRCEVRKAERHPASRNGEVREREHDAVHHEIDGDAVERTGEPGRLAPQRRDPRGDEDECRGKQEREQEMAHQSQGHRRKAAPGRGAQQPRRDAPQYIGRADAPQRPGGEGETQIENAAHQTADQDRLHRRRRAGFRDNMRSLDHLRPLFFQGGALARAVHRLERIAADRRGGAAQRMPATANVTPRGVNAKHARANAGPCGATSGRGAINVREFPHRPCDRGDRNVTFH